MRIRMGWKGIFLAFLPVGALTTGIAIFPGDADAAWFRFHPMGNCDGSIFTDVFTSVSNGLMSGVGTGTTHTTRCFFPDSSTFPKSQATQVNVHVTDDNPSQGFRATLCVTFYHAIGSACGTPSSTSTSFTGQTALTPGLEAFVPANDVHFGFLDVLVPRSAVSGTGSSIHGYFVADF